MKDIYIYISRGDIYIYISISLNRDMLGCVYIYLIDIYMIDIIR